VNPPDRTKRTAEKEQILLDMLSTGKSVYKAASAAGIARSTAYEWRDSDPEFKARWDEALEAGIDAMEDEAHRRAVEGVDKPVFYQGEVCGEVREYSDTLLIFQLKARRPEKYRENVNLNHSGTITVTATNFAVIDAKAEEVKLIE
jgi:transposase-like protein